MFITELIGNVMRTK